MNGDLAHLDWKPAILLRVARLPFGAPGGFSLRRAYLAVHQGQILHADWTLEAAERASGLVHATGWTLDAALELPLRLQGKGARFLPSGTWLLPYSDDVFRLYAGGRAALARLSRRLDQQPTDPAALAALIHLIRLL
ncbi:MAG: hypothetical protein IPK19_41370 [Chloroflexi bacterium]|nr:hypothetical protein [Chloroflexota bacterium]